MMVGALHENDTIQKYMLSPQFSSFLELLISFSHTNGVKVEIQATMDYDTNFVERHIIG